MKNGDVISEIKEMLPEEAKIEEICYEGANIVLYTRSTNYFLNARDTIKEIVNKVKKRIELRMDPNTLMPSEEAEKVIRSIVPVEANITAVWFDSKRSLVLIEAEKPGIVIGKEGKTMQEILAKTLWVPRMRRAPVIKSELISTIRQTLFQNSEYRRDFMNKIGKKIYHTKWERDASYWVRISCLGAGREVGRSCFLLQTPLSNVLLDCGVNVANTDQAYPYFNAPEFDVHKLDAVVITHSHLDHSGSVPLLYKYGYTGPIYCTEPTRDIMTLLQLDYVDVVQRTGRKPEYTSREIKEMIKNCISLDFNEVTDITPDIRLTLHNAGHVIGSSMVHLNIGEGFHNFLYTGDFKFSKTKLLEQSHNIFQRLETLMMESTYGASEDIQPTRKESEDFLVDSVKTTIESKGKVLIPVLGVGRAQEVMLIIEEAMRTGRIPEAAVHVDGMVWDVTAIHTTYPEYMNKEIRNLIFGEDNNPLTSKYFSRVASNDERQEIIQSKSPCVIIATSGMLTGGSSVEYFRNLAENKKNAIVFVSWQGEGSLGRKVQRGEKNVPVDTLGGKPEMVEVKLDVYSIEGLSGHSDRNQLINFVKNLNPKPKRILLVHGESSKCLEMASTIHKTLRIETNAPRNLDAFRLR